MLGIMILRAGVAVFLSLMAVSTPAAVEPPVRPEVPSAVVRAYLSALLDGNYADTYDYLSSRQRNGMSRRDWVDHLRRRDIKPRSEVLFLRVDPAIVRGEEATVVISLHLKTPEGKKVSRETYDLVREEGQWRIDGIKVFGVPAEQ